MPPPGTSDPAKGLDFSVFSPWIAAIVAAGGAFALFEPKLERIRAMKNETGRLEPGFLLFYVLPQRFLIFVAVGIVVFLSIGCIDVIQPTLLSGLPFIGFLRAALDMHNIAWTIVAGAILAIIIRWNWVPRVLLLLARAASALPIPWVRNRCGPEGECVGWHQAKAVCEGPDKGAPLLLRREDIDRVARIVLTRLSQKIANGGDDKNFAETPLGLSKQAKANMLLFGCIMEVNFTVNRWDRPHWKPFYAALADMEADKPIFVPSELLSFANGSEFFTAFRLRLDAALRARGLTPPPNQSLEAAGDIVRAWELLKKRGKGDTLSLTPWYACLLGGNVACLDRRLRAFPRMNGDGMRPQLLKLLTRWGCLPVADGIFVQPFSKTMAWMLLQEGALATLPETKEVTFNSFGQTPISRLAMKRVLRRVAELIAEQASDEAKSVAADIGDSEWRRFEAGDFILWSWSNEQWKEAAGTAGTTIASWDKAKWKWKFDGGRVVRQS